MVLAGAYAILASQNEINYVNSCEKPVSCGSIVNPAPKIFLSSSLTLSLQQAQVGLVLGSLAVGLGLVCLVYGIYLYTQARPEEAPLKTAPPPA